MGRFAVLLWISHYAGLFLQLNASGDVENHVSGNALFTEVPHDIISHTGEDVEMACSFRGAGSSSVSLEIQWWYLRYHREWSEKPSWTTNQVVPSEELTSDATKISVVKVAGSNISHRLRLSNVKPSDEGVYECRVIDFSNNHVQQHRVRAYLQVQTPGFDSQLHPEENLHSEEQSLHHGKHHLHKGDSQVRVRDKHNNRNQELHHEDYTFHPINHHKGHHGLQANEGVKRDSPSAQHNQEHNQREHHQLHEGKNHQAIKHTQASKKKEIKGHQSDVKGHKEYATDLHSNDCSTNDCVM
ncbi:V-set and transmembrane domain-containing protein 2-like protein precursor [Silurus asotus]|uniref:V-set and transmembrane domain-containing protein 2-like protein n=1 Tax=Silurus asotus TaxID=30991 RepID=A0AAD5B4R7_SILAS|nr:V-set and transmembrane domain-containing protein 2-like protein precursor [Silurus asotus]